jgi:acetyltransferase-like isoleucine patch superfamily enzyme
VPPLARRREKGTGELRAHQSVKYGQGVDIDTTEDVSIARGVAISDGVLILTHDHDPYDLKRKHSSPLHIGRGAWIGARAIILASCDRIGDKAVVGAGSVVTHDIPDGEVWAGNPARQIRKDARDGTVR